MTFCSEERKLSYLEPKMELLGVQKDVITASGDNGGGNNNSEDNKWELGPLPV